MQLFCGEISGWAVVAMVMVLEQRSKVPLSSAQVRANPMGMDINFSVKLREWIRAGELPLQCRDLSPYPSGVMCSVCPTVLSDWMAVRMNEHWNGHIPGHYKVGVGCKWR